MAEKSTWQVSIDETFWSRGRVNKSVAPGTQGPQIWIWVAVEVCRITKKCFRFVFRVVKQKSDALDGKPRGAKEHTQFVEATIAPDSTVVSDGWSATRAIDRIRLRMVYEWCKHSSKPMKKRIARGNSDASTESRTHVKKGAGKGKVKLGKLRPRMWVNARGWHSNHIESIFNKLKR